MDLLEPHIHSGRGVAFKADNGKWLSLMGPTTRRNLEAYKDAKDGWCRFEIEKVDEESVYLKSPTDNNRYLSRIYSGGVNYIWSAKTTPDPACLFKVYKDNGMISFLGSNNKYLGRFDRGGVQNIESVKDGIDFTSRFIVESYDPGKFGKNLIRIPS